MENDCTKQGLLRYNKIKTNDFGGMAMRRIRVGIVVVLSVLVALLAPRVGGLVANQFSYDSVDPDGVFAWLYVHHLVQAGIVFILMLVLMRQTSLRFGLDGGNQQLGLKYVIRFTVFFFLYTVVVLSISTLLSGVMTLPFTLNARNLGGYLSFQLLMSGPSEELIFRAFLMTVLGVVIHSRLLGGKLSTVNLIAALVFVVAHIGIQFTPFSLSYDPMQLLYSFALGVIYGDCYERTRSVVYPMALHSISNVISVSMVALFQVLFG